MDTSGYRQEIRIRTWKMEEVCPELRKDARQLVAWIDVGMEGGAVTVVLQAGEKLLLIDFRNALEQSLSQERSVRTRDGIVMMDRRLGGRR